MIKMQVKQLSHKSGPHTQVRGVSTFGGAVLGGGVVAGTRPQLAALLRLQAR